MPTGALNELKDLLISGEASAGNQRTKAFRGYRGRTAESGPVLLLVARARFHHSLIAPLPADALVLVLAYDLTCILDHTIFWIIQQLLLCTGRYE